MHETTRLQTGYHRYCFKDSFPFLIVRMPHIESNIPQNIFYSAIEAEFLRIACSTLCLRGIILKSNVYIYTHTYIYIYYVYIYTYIYIYIYTTHTHTHRVTVKSYSSFSAKNI